MQESEHDLLAGTICAVVRALQPEADAWVPFSRVGAPLAQEGVQYREHGFQKLRPFLNEFQDVLELRDEVAEGKTPVCYVRPRSDARCAPIDIGHLAAPAAPVPVHRTPRVPTSSDWLFSWASIPNIKIRSLS